MNLGVYITALDEEIFISHTYKQVFNIFPQVKVIDLGSEDSTLEQLSKLKAKVIPYKDVSGAAYTEIKNYYASLHDWVFWVDGDEIYPEGSLLKIKYLVSSGKYDSYRISWIDILKQGNTYYKRGPIINGTKVYNSLKMIYRRAWPKEVLDNSDGVKEPKIYNGVWCWHMRLMKRSNSRERTARRKKRETSMDQFWLGDNIEKMDNKEWIIT